MATNDIFEGEIIYDGCELDYHDTLVEDMINKCYWKSKDGRIIRVGDLNTNHLRNIALFLMGMGYQKCIAPESKRVIWLTVLRLEWERRLIQHNNKTWFVPENRMNEDRNRARLRDAMEAFSEDHE